jgi:hypothetical protein
MERKRNQEMDLEKVEINLEALQKYHGEQEIDEMTIDQIKQLHQETLESKGKEVRLGILSGSSRSMGIRTNPLNILKKTPSEEKKRGRKPYLQVIEETGAHLVDSGQVIGLPEIYFHSQPK